MAVLNFDKSKVTPRPGDTRIVPIVHDDSYNRRVLVAMKMIETATGIATGIYNFQTGHWESPPITDPGLESPFWGVRAHKDYQLDFTLEAARALFGETIRYSRTHGWEEAPQHAELLETEVKLLRQETEFLRNILWEVCRGDRKAPGSIIAEGPPQEDEQQGQTQGTKGSGSSVRTGGSTPQGARRTRLDCLSSLPKHVVGENPEQTWLRQRAEHKAHLEGFSWDFEGADAPRLTVKWTEDSFD